VKHRRMKWISLFLSMLLVMTVVPPDAHAAKRTISQDGFTFDIVRDDAAFTEIVTKYEGDEYRGILDRSTGNITIEVTGKDKERHSYEVQVENADGSSFSAVLKDKKDKREYRLGKDKKKVRAQFVIALPIAIGLIDALVMALLAASATIVIAGVTYYVASKVIENVKRSSYDYFMAVIRNNDVYIGPAIDYSTAFTRVYGNGDIWCRTQILCQTIAYNVSYTYNTIIVNKIPNISDKERKTEIEKRAGVIGPEIHGNGSSGYYFHYHPKNFIYRPHCFYA